MYFSRIRIRPGDVRRAIHRRLDDPGEDHHWLWRWFDSPPGTPRDFVFRAHRPLADPDAVVWPAHGLDPGDLPVYYVVSARPPRSEFDGWIAQTRAYEPAVEAGARLDFELRANPTVRHGPLRHEPRPADAPRHARRHDVVMDAKETWAKTVHAGRRWADIPTGDRPPTASFVEAAARGWIERCGQRHGFALDRGGDGRAGRDDDDPGDDDADDGGASARLPRSGCVDALRIDAYRQHALPGRAGRSSRPERAGSSQDARRDADSGRGASVGRRDPRSFSTIDFAGRLVVTDAAAFRGALLHGIGPAKAFGCGLLLVRRAA